jgi:hypothetical protein
VYVSPEYPSAASVPSGEPAKPPPQPQAWAAGGRIQLASWSPAAERSWSVESREAQGVGAITVDQFTVRPHKGDGGFGISIGTRQNGLAVDADATLYMSAPRVDFVLKVAGGKTMTAELVLSGAAGLRMGFVSATDVGRMANINKAVYVPVEFSIPFFEDGLPLQAKVDQSFVLNTVFSAKGQLLARGDYGFDGKITAGLHEGVFKLGGPGGFHVKDSLLRSIQGVSLGATQLTMSHSLRLLVGVGALGFSAGPYFSIISSMAVRRHSDLDTLVRCRGAAFQMDLDAGVGYRMPMLLVSVLNFFLRHLNVPEIAPFGGVRAVRQNLVDQSDHFPRSKACS